MQVVLQPAVSIIVGVVDDMEGVDTEDGSVLVSWYVTLSFSDVVVCTIDAEVDCTVDVGGSVGGEQILSAVCEEFSVGYFDMHLFAILHTSSLFRFMPRANFSNLL